MPDRPFLAVRRDTCIDMSQHTRTGEHASTTTYTCCATCDARLASPHYMFSLQQRLECPQESILGSNMYRCTSHRIRLCHIGTSFQQYRDECRVVAMRGDVQHTVVFLIRGADQRRLRG